MAMSVGSALAGRVGQRYSNKGGSELVGRVRQRYGNEGESALAGRVGQRYSNEYWSALAGMVGQRYSNEGASGFFAIDRLVWFAPHDRPRALSTSLNNRSAPEVCAARQQVGSRGLRHSVRKQVDALGEPMEKKWSLARFICD